MSAHTDKNLPGPETGYMSAFGDGAPTTLFIHGFAGSIRDTRPFAVGVTGTRMLMHVGGHGGRPSPGPDWTYETTASQVAQALAGSGATRALGVSMGAGSLARLITDGHPAAAGLEKVAFVLPASFDGFTAEHERFAREWTAQVRALLTAGDRAGLVELMVGREDPAVRDSPAVRQFAKQRVDQLFDTDLADGLGLATQIAVDHPQAARDFAGDVLILTHEDDNAHPVYIAQKYHAAFPGSRLEVLPPASILWKGAAEVRSIVTDFFNS